jgi:hypothetical protein
LLSDGFRLEAGCLTTPSSARKYLCRSKYVENVKVALKNGKITEKTIEEFVDSVSKEFKKGEQFTHELAFAAVAVVLEDNKTQFSERYLLSLTNLCDISELHMAPRIAKISLQELRRSMVANQQIACNARWSNNRWTPHSPIFSEHQCIWPDWIDDVSLPTPKFSIGQIVSFPWNRSILIGEILDVTVYLGTKTQHVSKDITYLIQGPDTKCMVYDGGKLDISLIS